MFLSKQHHIAIICSDYAKAKEFYIDKLGFELIGKSTVLPRMIICGCSARVIRFWNCSSVPMPLPV